MKKSITKSQYDQLVFFEKRARLLNDEIDNIFYATDEIIEDEDFSCGLIYNSDYLDVDEFIVIHCIDIGE